MINMESTVAHAFHRFALAILGLALPVALVAYGGNGDSRKAAPLAPKAAALGRSMPETPTGDVLTISSPAFADGAPIPEQYTCKGANIAPPLTWSAPFGGALVVDDPDAPREPYVHWIVIGIALVLAAPPMVRLPVAESACRTPAVSPHTPDPARRRAPGHTTTGLPSTTFLPCLHSRDWLGHKRRG